MSTKDNFSIHSDKYAKSRPTYPKAFFDYILSIISNKQNAWDCGTGTGQIVYALTETFDKVYATDISQAQIDNAFQADNILYSIQPSEHTNFIDKQFDLIMVAQAIHRFDFDNFYKEGRRTANDNALFCVMGYGMPDINEPINESIANFYFNLIGKYWDKEIKYLDANYETIPFPIDEITIPKFEIQHSWILEHLIGYFNTWSVVKHFIKQKGYNHVEN